MKLTLYGAPMDVAVGGATLEVYSISNHMCSRFMMMYISVGLMRGEEKSVSIEPSVGSSQTTI